MVSLLQADASKVAHLEEVAVVLKLPRRDQRKLRGIKGQRLSAGWNHDYLLQLLSS